jgi:hypothetical protein
MALTIRELERDVPASEAGAGQQAETHRAYLGVYCLRCGARPGEWCKRLTGSDVTLVRRLHLARLKRLAALDEQGWRP